MNFIGRVARLTFAAALVAGLGTTTSYAETTANPSTPTTDNASADNASVTSANGPAAVLEGQVAAANESGALVLRTADGMIALQVPPEEIQGVSIGETVRVPISENPSE